MWRALFYSITKDLVFTLGFRPELFVGQIKHNRHQRQEKHSNKASFFAIHQLWLGGLHEEGRYIFGEIFHIIIMRRLKFDRFIKKRRRH